MDFPAVLQPCPITGILNCIPHRKFHRVLIYVHTLCACVWVCKMLEMSRFRNSGDVHRAFEDTSAVCYHSLCITYGNVFALDMHESIVNESQLLCVTLMCMLIYPSMKPFTHVCFNWYTLVLLVFLKMLQPICMKHVLCSVEPYCDMHMSSSENSWEIHPLWLCWPSSTS